MARTAILAVRVIGDADNAAKALGTSERSVGRWERSAQRANRVAIGMGAALVALGKVTVDAASRQQQAAGAVEAAFGKQADAVDRLAGRADKAVGLSTAQYSELAAVLGSQLRNLGVSEDQLVGTTDNLIARGADLAATFGGTTAEAVEALSSLMRGERDPIERYGVSIKQADIDARLAAQGLDKLTGEARKQAETQATLAILTEQTANAQGQFAREAGSAAGASQIASAQFANAKAALGNALLPIVVRVAGALGNLANWVSRNTSLVTKLLAVAAALTGGIFAANAAIKAYNATHRVLATVLRVSTGETVRHRAATLASAAAGKAVTVVTKAWAFAQRVLNVALKSNPIGLVITVVAALVALFVTAYQRSERFRNIIQTVGRVGKAAFNFILNAARPLVNIVQSIVGWVQSLISAIRNINWPEPPGWVKSIGSAIGGLFGASEFPGPHEPGSPHPTSFNPIYRTGFMPHLGGGSSGEAAALLSALASAGGMTVINISGALDPDAVARQVERLLRRRASRTGRGVITRTVTP